MTPMTLYHFCFSKAEQRWKDKNVSKPVEHCHQKETQQASEGHMKRNVLKSFGWKVGAIVSWSPHIFELYKPDMLHSTPNFDRRQIVRSIDHAQKYVMCHFNCVFTEDITNFLEIFNVSTMSRDFFRGEFQKWFWWLYLSIWATLLFVFTQLFSFPTEFHLHFFCLNWTKLIISLDILVLVFLPAFVLIFSIYFDIVVIFRFVALHCNTSQGCLACNKSL